MKSTNRSIKQCAREKLLGRWNEHISFSMLLIATQILSTWITNMFSGSMAISVVFSLVAAVILQTLTGLFRAGASWHFLKNLRGQESPLKDMLVPLLGGADRFLAVELIRIIPGFAIYMPPSLIGFFWEGGAGTVCGLIWFAAGTVVYAVFFSTFAMTDYLLLDNPSLGAIEGMKKSAAMMKGHKGQYILLLLSFVGYVLLCLLSFGIGFVWVLPYMLTASASFYEQMENDEKGGGEPVL